MHLGKLKNESFIRDYKKYGFPTITHLVDSACDDLKRKLAKKRREQWRQEAHEEYASSNPTYIWESLDGENFVGD